MPPTRARRAGADIDWVVAALLHDVGDELTPYNHSEFAASILQPYVRAEVHWVIQHHGVFQSYYFAHHLGGDRNRRDEFRDHPWFDLCATFCAEWDQNSFDPDDPIDVGFTVWIAAYGPLGQLIESSLVAALPDGAAGGVWWNTVDPITTTMRFSGDGAIYDVDITATTGL